MSQQQNIANLLDPLVSNADASIGKAYQTIAKAMEQTLKVQQLTNLAMEQIYKTNVKLDSHIEPIGNGNLRILFTLGNLSPLPMKTVKGHLRFEDSLKIEINIAQAAKIFDENNLETYETSSLFDSQVDLLPQTEYEQVIELTTKEPVQCNGTIEISFLNPANEDTPIKIEHNFGLYLIDQLTKSAIDDVDKTMTTRNTKEYSTRFIREVFPIHPIEGIRLGMKFKFADQRENVIQCEVVQFTQDYTSATLEFYSDNERLLSMFIIELDKLSAL